MKKQPNKKHRNGGNIHSEGIYTRRGHTHGEDIHMERTCPEGTCIWRGSAHEGGYVCLQDWALTQGFALVKESSWPER